jgi:hypothetical protein
MSSDCLLDSYQASAWQAVRLAFYGQSAAPHVVQRGHFMFRPFLAHAASF